MDHIVKPKADFCFEVSWEVCNKIGGIYTVLKSKAAQLMSHYPKNYYLIGPYFVNKIKGEFQEEILPFEFQNIFVDLEKEGIKCYFGHWLIEGEPKVILIDSANLLAYKNQIKKELWEDYRIDSLTAGFDFDEPVVWSWAVSKFIQQAEPLFFGKKVVVHFHEWLSGAGLLFLKKFGLKVGTVFATHATTLGRTLANNSVPFFSLFDSIDPEKEAYHYGIQAKHQLEKNAALYSDVFVTVSEITGIEAQYFLGRAPDVLLPNGLDMAKFPNFEEIVEKHRIQRNRIREFLLYYFFPYYSFNIRDTLFYFIVGRYEFHNKGIDFFIKSLSRLNKKLKEINSKKSIVAFFWIPTEIRGIKPEIFEVQEVYRDIENSLEEVSEEVEENILYSLVAGDKPQRSELFEKDFWKEIQKKLLKFKRSGLPPVVTHNLTDPNDIILKTFKEEGLENKEEDRVKVVFYPVYLTGSDGLLNLNYYEGIQGSHLGVFPSFYEPWGYTPLETAALGVASVTTDLAGFGRFFRKKCEDRDYPGIFILDRLNRKDEEVIDSLAEILYRFSQFSHQERVENKIQARKMAALADWEILIGYYVEAHNLALEDES